MKVAVIGTGNLGVGFANLPAAAVKNTITTRATSPAFELIGEMDIHFDFFLGWGQAGAPSWVRV